MKKLCALIPMLAAIPALGGCAGTKPVQSVVGAGGSGVTSAIDIKIAAMNGTAMNSAITALTPAGKGTPTADAITQGAAYLATLTDTNPKYLLLATDGEPTCLGTSKDSTNAGPAAVTAIANALKAGFPTF